jgi:hypothetical protein
MLEDVPEVLSGLFHASGGGQFRNQRCKQTQAIQVDQETPTAGNGQEAQQFFPDTLPGNTGDEAGMVLDLGFGNTIDTEAKLGSQTHGSQQANGIRLKGGLGNTPDDTVLDVLSASEWVHQPYCSVGGSYLVEFNCHRIYRKITPCQVLLDTTTECGEIDLPLVFSREYTTTHQYYPCYPVFLIQCNKPATQGPSYHAGNLQRIRGHGNVDISGTTVQ